MNGNSLARQCTGTRQAKDVAKSAAKKRGEKCGEKCSEKRGEKCGENFDCRKTAFWELSRPFSFRSRDLVGNPFSQPLSPEIWQCRRLSLSLTAQCNPLSNVMQQNMLKDFIHPILGATTLLKAGTCHDMR